MDELPNELKLKILELCDFVDCMCFRETSRKNYDVGNYALSKTLTFDFRHFGERWQIEDEKRKKNEILVPVKMTTFMKYLPNLRKLILADLPCVIQADELKSLGKSLPQLKKCDIIQTEKHQWIGKDALKGLIYFEGLEKLKLEGWEPTNMAKRGNNSRFETIPSETLQKLVSFTIVCKQETVSKVLQQILEDEVIMTKCVKAKFNVRLSSPDIPHLIMKFIEFHPHIQKIAFNGFLFTTQEQVQSFYDHLLSLPQLERVQIDNCSVIDRIEQALQRTFLEALRKRGIQFNNLVKSMRHG